MKKIKEIIKDEFAKRKEYMDAGMSLIGAMLTIKEKLLLAFQDTDYLPDVRKMVLTKEQIKQNYDFIESWLLKTEADNQYCTALRELALQEEEKSYSSKIDLSKNTIDIFVNGEKVDITKYPYNQLLQQEQPRQVNFMQMRDLTDEKWLQLPKEEILQLYKNCYQMLQNYIGLSGESIPDVKTVISTDYKEQPMMTDGTLYPCPYSKAVRCTLEDPCNGCETWAKSLVGEEEPREPRLTDDQIELWAMSKEQILNEMPETLKLHIRKKIECRIEGAKWARDYEVKEEKK